MSDIFRIKRGLDIKLKGKAPLESKEVDIRHYALKPTDYIGVFPKLLLKAGDKVKAGQPVFYDKYREDIRFSSPVSGTITDIVRGEKRKMLEIRIEADGANNSIDYGKDDPSSISREKLIQKLLDSGAWAAIRQRPYNVIAHPGDKPKGIFISAFDSAPLAPDMNYVMRGREADFQAGIDALNKLTDGKVHLSIHRVKTEAPCFIKAKNVVLHTFEGPHPAGNVGIQIHHIDPINKGEVAWVVDPQDVAMIGQLVRDGIYRPQRTIALAGSEVKKQAYYTVLAGALLAPLFENNITKEHVRFISGNVLTGDKIEKHGYLGFYHNMATVIPEGDYYEFLGWIAPRFNKFSLSRSYFSWLMPNKEYVLDTNLNGEHRAFVMSNQYEKVLPMDIFPVYLLKAILAKDIDQMERLGIYEVDEEDFALCEFACTSKIGVQELLRNGLDMMRKEMS